MSAEKGVSAEKGDVCRGKCEQFQHERILPPGLHRSGCPAERFAPFSFAKSMAMEEAVEKIRVAKIGIVRRHRMQLSATRPEDELIVRQQTLHDPKFVHDVRVLFPFQRRMNPLRTRPGSRAPLAFSIDDPVPWGVRGHRTITLKCRNKRNRFVIVALNYAIASIFSNAKIVQRWGIFFEIVEKGQGNCGSFRALTGKFRIFFAGSRPAREILRP